MRTHIKPLTSGVAGDRENADVWAQGSYVMTQEKFIALTLVSKFLHFCSS
jgi:hypothetical protein